jgi:hypothetical protein
MATSFKTLGNGDIQATRNNLHEAIPITGSITSGSYIDASGLTFPSGLNIKNYAHGLFQSCFDYPYLSSSANHIFDLTTGYSKRGSSFSLSASTNIQNEQKQNMYYNMAQVLAGYDTTGSIQFFTGSGVPQGLDNAIFVNFARLLGKDEIQKGTFSMTVGLGDGRVRRPDDDNAATFVKDVTAAGVGGSSRYFTDSPAGEYNFLYASSSRSQGNLLTTNDSVCGLIYYQAGIAILSSSLFLPALTGGLVKQLAVAGSGNNGHILWATGNNPDAGGTGINGALTGTFISGAANGFRARLQNVSFSNTTELNSTIYFCRANANDFNYSSNPTYLKSSKIRVKEQPTDQPTSYITTVGLYGANNEMLAVAKLSEPLKKTSANEFTLRVRLDY